MGDSQLILENARPLSPTRDSRPKGPDLEKKYELVNFVVFRIRLSKMAMTRNIEMRMVVATKPKETTLTESLNIGLHFSSCQRFVGALTSGY